MLAGMFSCQKCDCDWFWMWVLTGSSFPCESFGGRLRSTGLYQPTFTLVKTKRNKNYDHKLRIISVYLLIRTFTVITQNQGENHKISWLWFAQNVSSVPSLSHQLVADKIRPETSTNNHKKQAGKCDKIYLSVCLSVCLNQSLPSFIQYSGQGHGHK